MLDNNLEKTNLLVKEIITTDLNNFKDVASVFIKSENLESLIALVYDALFILTLDFSNFLSWAILTCAVVLPSFLIKNYLSFSLLDLIIAINVTVTIIIVITIIINLSCDITLSIGIISFINEICVNI